MSQLPCQGQQEMTSVATGLVPSLVLPEVPLTSGVSGSSLEFSLPRHSPEGDLRKRIQGPAPQPCRSWQLPTGPGHVEQKSAARGSGPE